MVDFCLPISFVELKKKYQTNKMIKEVREKNGRFSHKKVNRVNENSRDI